MIHYAVDTVDIQGRPRHRTACRPNLDFGAALADLGDPGGEVTRQPSTVTCPLCRTAVNAIHFTHTHGRTSTAACLSPVGAALVGTWVLVTCAACLDVRRGWGAAELDAIPDDWPTATPTPTPPDTEIISGSS